MAVDTALSVALAPLLLAQTAITVLRAERLPEPDGPRAGRTGIGAPLRYLQLGDSSAAGVGVAHQCDALAPQLAQALGQDRCIDWTLCAENGATTADALRLLETVGGQTFDIAYVIFGVNDAKNLRAAAAWRRDYAALLARLRAHHRVQHTFVCGLPPVEEFPLIPRPLRTVLGMRARRFDRILQDLVADLAACDHLPLPTELDPSGIARDGFHPGAPIYARWAREAAEQMRPTLLNMTRPDHPRYETHCDEEHEGERSRQH